MSAMFPLLLHLLSTTTSPAIKIGNDISYPYCNKQYPHMNGFGIVGVNGGIASETNPCLAAELFWAGQSLNNSQKVEMSLYVNTGDPGANSAFWPITIIDPSGNFAPNPYGSCSGTNSVACSWQYGWNRAIDDIQDKFIPAATTARVDVVPSDYMWWLDVETKNSWQTGSSKALAKNRADLEGMVAAFHSKEVSVGIYASSYQWKILMGTISSNSTLNGLGNWRPGASDVGQARSNCSLTPLTQGGTVIMTQYTTNIDYDYACL